jgi:hypothetical protein
MWTAMNREINRDKERITVAVAKVYVTVQQTGVEAETGLETRRKLMTSGFLLDWFTGADFPSGLDFEN